MTRSLKSKLLAGLLAGAVQFGVLGFAFADTTILNVSYDPTRELYKEFNEAFAAKWKADTGETVTIQQSHGGSGKQARAVIDGLDADVVTLALESDINAIVENPRRSMPDWRSGCRNNPRPTPRRSSSWCARAIRRASRTGATWSRKASRSSRRTRRRRAARAGTISPPGPGPTAVRRRRGQGQGIRRQPLSPRSGARHRRARLDRDLRRRRGLGDVLLAWENEAYLALDEFGADQFDIVYPAASILAEPPVAVVDANVDAKGTRKVAEAYLNISIPRKARRSPPRTTIGRRSPIWCRPTSLQASRHQAGHHRRPDVRRMGEGAAVPLR